MVQYHHVSPPLDRALSAVADGTRRGILQRLTRRDASITELALEFDMTLTGMKKHVQLLEEAGLVRTKKVGRVRTCQVGPQRLDNVAAWISQYQKMLDERLDSLENFLERTRDDDWGE